MSTSNEKTVGATTPIPTLLYTRESAASLELSRASLNEPDPDEFVLPSPREVQILTDPNSFCVGGNIRYIASGSL